MFKNKSKLKQELLEVRRELENAKNELKINEQEFNSIKNELDKVKKELETAKNELKIKTEMEEINKKYDIILNKIENPDKNGNIRTFGYRSYNSHTEYIICIKYLNSYFWVPIYNYVGGCDYEIPSFDIEHEEAKAYDELHIYKELSQSDIDCILKIIEDDKTAKRLFEKYLESPVKEPYNNTKIIGTVNKRCNK